MRQFVHDDTGELAERLTIVLGEALGARRRVEHTKPPERMARGRRDGGAGVEANGRPAGHEWVVLKTRVVGRVLDDEELLGAELTGGERHVDLHLLGIVAHLRPGPPGVVVDEVDPGHGGVKEARREVGNAPERLFGEASENAVAAQGGEPIGIRERGRVDVVHRVRNGAVGQRGVQSATPVAMGGGSGKRGRKRTAQAAPVSIRVTDVFKKPRRQMLKRGRFSAPSVGA